MSVLCVGDRAPRPALPRRPSCGVLVTESGRNRAKGGWFVVSGSDSPDESSPGGDAAERLRQFIDEHFDDDEEPDSVPDVVKRDRPGEDDVPEDDDLEQSGKEPGSTTDND
jgi:hypothetical protein